MLPALPVPATGGGGALPAAGGASFPPPASPSPAPSDSPSKSCPMESGRISSSSSSLSFSSFCSEEELPDPLPCGQLSPDTNLKESAIKLPAPSTASLPASAALSRAPPTAPGADFKISAAFSPAVFSPRPLWLSGVDLPLPDRLGGGVLVPPAPPCLFPAPGEFGPLDPFFASGRFLESGLFSPLAFSGRSLPAPPDPPAPPESPEPVMASSPFPAREDAAPPTPFAPDATAPTADLPIDQAPAAAAATPPASFPREPFISPAWMDCIPA